MDYAVDGWFIRPFHSFPLYSTPSTFLYRVCCALVNLAHSQKQRFQSLLLFSFPKITKGAGKPFLFSYVKRVSRVSTYFRHNIKASQIYGNWINGYCIFSSFDHGGCRKRMGMSELGGSLCWYHVMPITHCALVTVIVVLNNLYGMCNFLIACGYGNAGVGSADISTL